MENPRKNSRKINKLSESTVADVFVPDKSGNFLNVKNAIFRSDRKQIFQTAPKDHLSYKPEHNYVVMWSIQNRFSGFEYYPG